MKAVGSRRLAAAIKENTSRKGNLGKKGLIAALNEVLPTTKDSIDSVRLYLTALVAHSGTRWAQGEAREFAERLIEEDMTPKQFNEAVAVEGKLHGLEPKIRRAANSGQGVSKGELAGIMKDAYGDDDALPKPLRDRLLARLDGNYGRSATRSIAERILKNGASAAQAGAALGFVASSGEAKC